MKILAIETSCDETAVAIINTENNKFAVLSNIVSSQIAIHEKFGGVVPSLAAREHAANIGHIFNTAIKEAGIVDFGKEIDLIAVTHGPGLGPALLVGLTFARTLSWQYDKPIVGINHLDGHIHSNWLSPINESDPIFPAMNLIVSGGHTELVLMRDHGEYQIIGETLDDAIGESFDKVARLLDLGYPGGPRISKLAAQGNPEAYTLPRPMEKSGDFNFSYSGLKTAVLYLIRDLGGQLTEQQKADVAASFQKAALDVLISKTKKAAEEYDIKSILLSGGVSANKMLRGQLGRLAEELDVKYFCPNLEYTGDNAAMIAVAAYFAHTNKKLATSWSELQMNPNLKLS